MFFINNILEPESYLTGTKFYNSDFKNFFDSLNIFNISFSYSNDFSYTPSSIDFKFNLKKDEDTYVFLISSVHKKIFLFQEKLTPISFEKLIDDYFEPSKLEEAPYAFFISTDINPTIELKTYLEHRIAIEQEINTRKNIFIQSYGLVTISQKESLKVTFSDGFNEFIVHFEPFASNRIRFNNRLCFFAVNPNFFEEIHSEESSNHFIQNIRMKILELMVQYRFTNSKEYKMRSLYDDEFSNKWKLQLK
jgi:hypothetical protein